MFGYVKPYTPLLRVKDDEFYRAVYCGLCGCTAKCNGCSSTVTLSYDIAFLALVRMSLAGEKLTLNKKRCPLHPLKKRNVMDRNEQLDLCAHAAAILGYHKIKDDLSDEKGLKKLKARLAYPFVASWRRRALKAGFDDLDKSVADSLGRLAELEGKELASVDAPAELFGELLARITSYGLEGARARIAAELGRCVGKWIYIVDALDDCAEDKEKNRYNPFLLLYGGRLPEGAELASISDALKLELCGAEAAMDLLETDKIPVKNIIENILYLGMPQTVDRIVCEENESKNGKKPKKKGKSENERSL